MSGGTQLHTTAAGEVKEEVKIADKLQQISATPAVQLKTIAGPNKPQGVTAGQYIIYIPLGLN